MTMNAKEFGEKYGKKYTKLVPKWYAAGYLGATTKDEKTGKEITHKDLRKAICVMEEKHSNCRWKSEKIRSKRHYILIEGFYWLIYVYFQKDKNQIDADIDFFEKRIQQYEETLHLSSKKLFEAYFLSSAQR